jgi:peptide deformylase
MHRSCLCASSSSSSSAAAAAMKNHHRGALAMKNNKKLFSSSSSATTISTRLSAYGTSDVDGTWTENASNPFTNLISLAKGQREIVQAGEACLYERSEEVDERDIDSTEIQELVSEMLAIVKGRGVGLAAVQIGVKKRIFVMEDTAEGMSDESEEERERKKRAPFKAKVVINPVLIPIGDASAAFMEGCLSVQGYRALVRRHLKVKLKGVAPDGKPIEVELTGWPARIAQHEMDHLDGVLYVDRMEKRTLRRVDKVNAPVPTNKHPEFGTCPAVGETATGGSYLSNKTAIAGVDDIESLTKKSKNRRRR